MLEDKQLMEEEARRLWLLNWHSGWTAKCNTDKVHYNSLDHVYLFGPTSRQEHRLDVQDVLEDIICALERTIEGEFALEAPSLSTLALDDDIDAEEKEEIESQLPQTVGEGDVLEASSGYH